MKSNFKDIAGQIFHRWRVLSLDGKDKHGQFAWLCECECGKKKTILGGELRRGKTKSCGCWRVDAARKAHTKHGWHGSPEYRAWRGMLDRVDARKGHSKKLYGDRGITVAIAWRKFDYFILDVGPMPKPGLTLDRINNNGNYEPRNVRWATRKQQQNNTRTNVFIEHSGQCLTATEWSEKLRIPVHKIWKAAKEGRPLKDLL